MAFGCFVRLVKEFPALASRFLAVLALALFPTSQIWADNRTPLPFDENSFFGYDARIISIPSSLVDRAINYAYDGMPMLAMLKELPAFPIFKLRLIGERDYRLGYYLDRYDFNATRVSYYSYSKSSCPYVGETSLQYDAGWIIEYGFAIPIPNAYPRCPTTTYVLDVTHLADISSYSTPPSLMKDYCFPTSFKKLLAEKMPNYELNHENYCGGICDESEYYDKEAEKCKQKITRIYFFNGITYTMDDAKHEKDSLQKLYKQELENNATNGKFQFDIGYNFSFGAIKDLTEVFRQKWNEKNSVSVSLAEANAILRKCSNERWLKTDPTCLDFTKMHNELAERIAEDIFSPKYITFDILELNTAALIGKLEKSLAKGERVIIFAHSQGNLFGNNVFNALKQEYPDRIGMIGVASARGVKIRQKLLLCYG